MFNFLSMADNYEQRVVANFVPEGASDWLVDTAAVTDSEQPFETAVQHPRYNEGAIVIVELYDTREEALAGHERWVKTMTAKKLPATLKDVSTCEVVDIGLALGVDVREEHVIS